MDSAPPDPAGSSTEPTQQSSRFSTADLIGPTLIFLGGFLLAVAVALPTLLAPTLRLIPLHTDQTTVAVTDADTVTVFDRCSIDEPTARSVDTEVIRQQRVVAVRPADDRRITLQAGTSIRGGEELEECDDATLTAVRDRVTLDRDTARPLGPTSEIQYDSRTAPLATPDRAGFTYLLGRDAAGDLEYFDVTTRQEVPLRDDGPTEVDGRAATRFVADVPDTDLHALDAGRDSSGRPTAITRPASWFGIDEAGSREITVVLHHRGQHELIVDDATGTVLDQRITVEERYLPVDATGLPTDFALVNIDTTFAYDERTREDMVSVAAGRSTPMTIWTQIVPVIAAVLGVLTIIVGVLWLLPETSRRRLLDRLPVPRRSRSAPNEVS